jgi:hypothetical protein
MHIRPIAAIISLINPSKFDAVRVERCADRGVQRSSSLPKRFAASSPQRLPSVGEGSADVRRQSFR